MSSKHINFYSSSLSSISIVFKIIFISFVISFKDIFVVTVINLIQLQMNTSLMSKP